MSFIHLLLEVSNTPMSHDVSRDITCDVASLRAEMSIVIKVVPLKSDISRISSVYNNRKRAVPSWPCAVGQSAAPGKRRAALCMRFGACLSKRYMR